MRTPERRSFACAARLVFSCTVLALGSSALAAQAEAPKFATLTGVVTNINGVPVPKAEVIIVSTDQRAISNDSGVYEFLNAPAGKQRLVARRIGFQPSEERVTLDAGRHKQVDFELVGVPEQLDSVMVREAGGNGRMTDFWARRMVGVGAFITRADIERRKPQYSSDLLRTVTGVKVILGESGFDRPYITMGRSPVMNRGAGRGQTQISQCNVSYYVNGSYVPSGTFHLDDVSPMMLEAVEVYRGPSEVPAKLRQRDTACGLIVVWTREPPAAESKKPPGLGW